ncbi:hypothetical protein E1B28_005914 [Marasmius oreades]|uniref:Endopeptidase S2P n=1 Tax=Marasmius oreades TaxID=181124 RepID=A0A9P7UV24_9AGAR|nr:uncharacterized protein E1B28_005914 [Marasmius oreades]KAG7095133.1 hypothetical protein E1B28_005914 [Marasmius oreades]
MGMLCAVCALAWLSGVLLWDLVQISSRVTERSSSLSVQKRDDMELSRGTMTTPASKVFIIPIIPGLTVPFVHLPVILLAVFLCQIFHEFGHVISAALESVSLFSIENLSPRRKGRIIAGGPCHNIVMWLLLLGVGRTSVWLEKSTSIGSTFLGLLYEDISHIGRAVVDIEEGSPLKDFLLVGSIVTHLDDVPLAVVQSRDDIWSTYLSEKGPDEFRLLNMSGWCVPRTAFQGAACCYGTRGLLNPALSCFKHKKILLDDRTDWNKGCLDPIDILAHSPPRTRCIIDEECSGPRNHHDSDPDAICVGPDEETTSFTRLTIRRHHGDAGVETLVWNGPKIEIWEQVKVSRWASRFWFVPMRTLFLAGSCFDYLVAASLSLFFFNLLPVPLLDGGQLLKALLNNLPELHAGDFDIESMRSGQTPGRRKARIERGIMFWTTGMLVACVLMAVLRTMKT